MYEYDDIDLVEVIERLIGYCKENKYTIEKIDIKKNFKTNEAVIRKIINEECENTYCIGGVWDFE